MMYVKKGGTTLMTCSKEATIEEKFDESIKMAVKIGRKYMNCSGKKPSTEEWNLALILFEGGYYSESRNN